MNLDSSGTIHTVQEVGRKSLVLLGSERFGAGIAGGVLGGGQLASLAVGSWRPGRRAAGSWRRPGRWAAGQLGSCWRRVGSWRRPGRWARAAAGVQADGLGQLRAAENRRIVRVRERVPDDQRPPTTDHRPTGAWDSGPCITIPQARTASPGRACVEKFPKKIAKNYTICESVGMATRPLSDGCSD